MSRFVAFLRAINVGGHVVKMDQLRDIFETLGFANVETFIASGNVIFESTKKNISNLEKNIEQSLREALGYDVATFIRTGAEITSILQYEPFPSAKMDTAVAMNIAFLSTEVDDNSRKALLALRSEIDDFNVHGREIYWLCRKKQSESTFSNAVLEKTIGQPSTLRGISTFEKICAKYFSPTS